MNENIKSRTLLTLLIVFFSLGAGLSGYLVTEHYEFLSGDRQEAAYCNVSQWVNCDAVSASPYSKVFGVYNASLGIGLFVLCILLAFGFLASKEKEHERHFFISLLCLATTIMTAYATWLVAVSLFVVKAICINCLALDALVFGSFVIVLMLLENSYLSTLLYPFKLLRYSLTGVGSSLGRMRLPGWIFIATICIASAIFFDNFLSERSFENNEARTAYLVGQLQKSTIEKIDVAQSPKMGGDKPLVTLVEFSDFACPFCKRAAFLSKAVVRGYNERVQFYFKHYPLDSECNYRVQRTVHPYACEAARGSICAMDQKRFWDYHDAVFSLTPPFNSKTAENVAQDIGLDMPTFNRCLDSEKTRERLRSDIEQAHRVNIEGTPAFFFNGRKISGILQAPVMQALINKTIEMDKAGKP